MILAMSSLSGFQLVFTYTPAPPGPKREGTDPSVHTWISDGGREDSLLEADWSRAVLLLVQISSAGMFCCTNWFQQRKQTGAK